LKDKYGVSWQIVPPVLGGMLQDKDAEKSKRVMQAMLQMDKLGVTPIIWTVTGAKVRAPVWGIFCFQSLLLSKMAFINAL
jgi:hypothetical protein